MKRQIGYWIEKTGRELTAHPTYYAADWETVRTIPGRYPLFVDIIGGYIHPMPQWVLCSIDAVRTAGQLYNGFGGVNFSSQELPKEPTSYHIQGYAYQLKEMPVELFPEWKKMATDALTFAKSLKWGEGVLS